jgi:hypothetical protein
LLRLEVGGDPPLLDCSFAARYTFQKSHPILKGFEGDDIDQIGSWHSVLGDEDRRLIFRQLRENFGGVPLQCCNQLSFHKSDTKVSFCRWQAQTSTDPLHAVYADFSRCMPARLQAQPRRRPKALILPPTAWLDQLDMMFH